MLFQVHCMDRIVFLVSFDLKPALLWPHVATKSKLSMSSTNSRMFAGIIMLPFNLLARLEHFCVHTTWLLCLLLCASQLHQFFRTWMAFKTMRIEYWTQPSCPSHAERNLLCTFIGKSQWHLPKIRLQITLLLLCHKDMSTKKSLQSPTQAMTIGLYYLALPE